MIDLAMETEECKLPLDDWLVGAESGFRINKALLAEQVASDEGGNLICVCQTFWEYSCGPRVPTGMTMVSGRSD